MILKFLKTKLRNITWLARLYRKYILKLPLSFDAPKYSNAYSNNQHSLMILPRVSDGPLISIIVPVYKPNFEHFRAMVDSVINQSYENWELILVDDASFDTQLTSYLASLVDNEKIKVINRKENGHISRASNDGLFHASGEFIALLDHDDLLNEHALNAMALFIKNYPNSKIFYSDEDKVLEDGSFDYPHYKPKWNPDLLFSHNYVCHLGVYKRTLLNDIGGFRLGVEGSQDYDLILRASSLCKDEQITHVPYVLYSWRMAEGSTALSSKEKTYTHDAGKKALQDFFCDTLNSEVKVEDGMLDNTYRVRWPLPDQKPLVSIIIPTRNGKALVEQCVNSIFEKTKYCNYEILLVDNQSDEAESLLYFDVLSKNSKVQLLKYNNTFNYSAINNFAVSRAKGEVIVLMNNDIEVLTSDWLEEMVGNALRNDIGCVGAKLYYPNGQIQHAGVITGIGGVAGHSHKYFPKEHPGYFKRLMISQNLSAVTAACLAVRKSLFEQVSGLDEDNLTVAFNDVDFCLKIQALGYRNLWTPYVEMIHHESISRGAEDTPEKIHRFNKEVNFMQVKWGRQLFQDPCYSPWLTLEREDFTFND